MSWHLLWICSILSFYPYLSASILDDLSHDKDWPYQDLRINGKTLRKGCGPNCELRYEALRPVLDQLKQPFSVLEIGANNGYFSLRIAEDYDSFCTMIDGTNRLKKICEYNSEISHLTYLQKFLTPQDIEWLAEHEHFDVVICFHVLHHVDWKRFLPALFKLADHVIIETPPVNDGFVLEKPTIPAIANHLLGLPNGVCIGSFQRQAPHILDHMIWFPQPQESSKNAFKKKQKGVSRKTFNHLNGVFRN